MKRDFLKKLIPDITDEVIDAILNEHGKGISAVEKELTEAKEKLSTVTTENDDLKGQLKSRDKDLEALKEQVAGHEDLTTQLGNLQKKYDDDTKSLNEKLEAQAYDFDAERFLAGYEFSSDYAKKAILSEFKEQKFKRDTESREFLGGKEWMEKLKEKSPSAFKAEAGGDPPPDPHKPYFSQSTRTDPQKKTSLIEKMKLKNENPKAIISFDD